MHSIQFLISTLTSLDPTALAALMSVGALAVAILALVALIKLLDRT